MRIPTIACLFIPLLASVTSCVDLPKEMDTTPSVALPIDGRYEMLVSNQRKTLIVDRGRIYFEDNRRLIAKDIGETAPGLYECQTIFLKAGQVSFLPCRLDARSGSRLVLEVPPAEDRGWGGSTETYYLIDGKSTLSTDPAGDERGAAPSLSLELDPAERLVEASSEQISVIPGVKVRLRRSRTIEHSVSLTSATHGETNATMGIPAIYQLQVKGQLERTLGRSFEQSETVEQEVELDGSVNRRYRLVWYDRLRTGIVHLNEGAARKTYSFVFKEWSELRVEGVEESGPAIDSVGLPLP